MKTKAVVLVEVDDTLEKRWEKDKERRSEGRDKRIAARVEKRGAAREEGEERRWEKEPTVDNYLGEAGRGEGK